VSQDEHALALDKVRFVGDPVAVVAATTEDVATQALDLIEVAYEPLRIEDRTAALLGNARGRLSARLAHRAELEQVEGTAYFERQVRYLETVVELAERGATSRVSYLAERH
jgi:CO/xanthine dehydrogenase Mo-binding subunit